MWWFEIHIHCEKIWRINLSPVLGTKRALQTSNAIFSFSPLNKGSSQKELSKDFRNTNRSQNVMKWGVILSPRPICYTQHSLLQDCDGVRRGGSTALCRGCCFTWCLSKPPPAANITDLFWWFSNSAAHDNHLEKLFKIHVPGPHPKRILINSKALGICIFF